MKMLDHTYTTASANQCTVKAAYPESFQASQMCEWLSHGTIMFIMWPAIPMFTIDTVNNQLRHYRFHCSQYV